MVAYASLVSLMTPIEQIQHHPRPPITLHKEQVESLRMNITFLQDFLEVYSHAVIKEADGLESRIADAAYAAEDIIGSHARDQIFDGSRGHREKIGMIEHFRQCLQKEINDMDFIRKEVMEIKEMIGIQDHQLLHPVAPSSLRSHPTEQKNDMVGFDDILNEVMDKLTGYNQCSRQIIPIVGMGGIGKTTLPKNAYDHQLIVEHFEIRSWVTISHEYNAKNILLEILLHQRDAESRDYLSQMSKEELGVKLNRCLYGRRYLVTMDDMWSIEAWDKVNRFLPDNNNGSRIMITTRISNVAFQLSGCHSINVKFLDEDKSWNLLYKKVFGEEACPVELEEIGKKIAKNCKGLPLSIAVIGGLLAKSQSTQVYWENILENLASILNLEDDERCLRILQTSYIHLPVHLKPCFLYMGVFTEDSEISTSILTKLWMAEGFVKPTHGKNLEVVAEEYLKDLVDRNLVLVKILGSTGKIKLCNIHDLVRDLCLREAEKEKFLCVARKHSPDIEHGIHARRRIALHGNTLQQEHLPQILDALQSESVVRSVIRDFNVLTQLPFKWLRILKMGYHYAGPDVGFELVNSRFLYFRNSMAMYCSLRTSMHLYWNLQTLMVTGDLVGSSYDIWKMHQLRHVKVNWLYLVDPPPSELMDGKDDEFVLRNLQRLSFIVNLRFTEEVIKRIPNIKKLGIGYYNFSESWSHYCLNHLDRLQKLESLSFKILIRGTTVDLARMLAFPQSLKKLDLGNTNLHWEYVTTAVGSLPLLQVLKLRLWSVVGSEWNSVDGKFQCLRFLKVHGCLDLEEWTAENTHFPCLEHLSLANLRRLKEIPSGIGDIPTLQSVVLNYCSHSAVISAQKIREEQEELGNVGLKVRVEDC